jgi:ABC-2 type transport system permease protein
MKEIRLAKKIIGVLVKDRVQYPVRLIAETMSLVARCGFLLVIYYYVFQLNGGAINNTPYVIIAWSMFFYFAFSVFRLRDISKMIMNDVQSGNVEVLFSKPISYLMYRFYWQIGTGAYSSFMSTIIGSLVLIFVVGIPRTMTISVFLPTMALAFIGAGLLSLILYSIVGLLAFWIEEVNPVFWIVDKTVMILGGSYLPVALFPAFMYKIARYSPFGASQFVSYTVYDNWQANWPMMVGTQLFWIILLGLVMYFMFIAARRKVSVNGG